MSPQPRSVTPGIETHESIELEGGETLSRDILPAPGLYCGLDWIRCTGPDDLLPRVHEWLCGKFGSQPRRIRGAKFFCNGTLWDPGVMLSWGHAAQVCQIDLQGQRLASTPGPDRLGLLFDLLGFGMKPTRLDGALDWVGQAVGLCEAASDACARGELCTLRKYRPSNEYTSENVPTRLHLALGSRESEACARIYDKGLERQNAPQGYWERLEVEWKGDRAPEVARLLRDARGSATDALASLIAGAIDFRVRNDRSELDRRPPAKWWTKITSGIGRCRPSIARREESFDRWAESFRTAYGRRILELADAAGTTAEAVVWWLLAGSTPSRNGGAVVAEFLRVYRTDRDGTCGSG